MVQLGLLLLVTYALHIVEEYTFGFPAWAEAHTGLAFTREVFLRLNATFFGVMTAGVVAGMLFPSAQWLVVPLGTAVLIKGNDTSREVFFRSMLPGAIIGLGAAAFLTRNWDPPDLPVTTSVIPVEGGGMAVFSGTF